jgi:uncharacterized RDD family membrane protein YckC
MEQPINSQGVPVPQIQYASFGRRLLAYFVDFLILFSVGMVLQSCLGKNPFLIFRNAKSLEEIQQMQSSTSTTLASLIGLVVGLAYFLIFYVNYDGATPGKRLMAIKVTKDDGSRLTYPVVFVRYLGTLISAFLFGLGYLWVVWDKKKQALHDKIAKTVVVKTEGKPRTLSAVIITLLAILFFSFYMGLMIYQGFKLGMEQVKRDTGGFVGRSIKQYQETMSPEAKIHYDKSMQLLKEMRAVQTDPEKVKKLNDENIQELKKAAELDPKNAEIWYQLGNAYTWVSSTGTLEDGLNAYKKAEEIDPNNVIYINGVGDMLIQMGKYEEAILQFQKTLRLTDKSGFANLSVAHAYAKLGIKDSAKEHYQKAIDIFTSQNATGSYDEQILQARKGIAEVSK